MFQFSGLALCNYEFITQYLVLGGLPHSEIFGSQLVVSYPKLFADFHVLLRLLLPSHPPYALYILTI